MILALDPGMNSPGVAIFQEASKGLVAAGRVLVSWEFAELPAGERWLRVAREIVAWFVSKTIPACAGATIVFECPQWYQHGKSKGDPNQLVGIAGVAANVTGLLGPSRILSPTPSEWVGQVPKVCPTCKGKAKKKCLDCRGSAWETPRGRRIRSRLSEAELALVPDQNDAIDAVGLGLWALGRLTPRTVYSNGRDGH